VATVLAGCALTFGASGCGDDESGASEPGAVQTGSPLRTFAPLVEVAADEPWRPMSARWFLERSIFWFAEDDGCADRKIAVGHTLPEQQNIEIDWIYAKGLGGWSWPAYYRDPYDAQCELNTDLQFDADELTRPHDPGPRADGVRPGEGYYLDLVDAARSGPAAGAKVPAYAERTDEGDGSVRLTYWTLFGMHGTPGEPDAHEGDWVRVDVLVRDVGDGGYEPVAVQVEEAGAGRSADVVTGPDGTPVRETAWSATRRAGDTHSVVRLASRTHTVTVAASGRRCADCSPLETWKSLVDVRKEVWYGFGGAWGAVGATSATTGPLGPHRFFPTAAEKAQERAGGGAL
jgi:hypothetical protein